MYAAYVICGYLIRREWKPIVVVPIVVTAFQGP